MECQKLVIFDRQFYRFFDWLFEHQCHLNKNPLSMASYNQQVLLQQLVVPSLAQIGECLQALSGALRDQEYAVIGGAAMVAMGSTHRTTHDVDILVRRGSTIGIKNLLGACQNFMLDRRTRHLTFSSPNFAGQESAIEIDVLTEVFANIPETELQTTVATQSGVFIPNPSILLNCKISTSYERASLFKKISDWSDVEFLIQWHVSNGLSQPLGSIPNATSEAYLDLLRFCPAITPQQWNFIGGLLPTPLQHQVTTSSVSSSIKDLVNSECSNRPQLHVLATPSKLDRTM
jgi:hypothetical protein